MTQLMTLPDAWEGMPATFIEGALLAANANPKPLVPEAWLPTLVTGGVEEDAAVTISQADQTTILNHFEMQYRLIKAGEYVLPAEIRWDEAQGLTPAMSEFAAGFLTVWPLIEPAWGEQAMSDGTMRMLSAFITTLMLMVDEENTLAQMEEAGVTGMPAPAVLYAQLPLMLSEVVMAADECQQGAAAQAVNPYKETGRNDECVCGSGKKFKQCCGQ
ncbi:YecA family protein [Photobacterium aphoticum]|uniref:Prepilin peptidase n=1 Tax=Photobacterium aphoticum TaxID=754436 RepID=A0A0J1GI80_9GAMM|nr:SEC-C metal-binding domain-containing protein [Photobacterium aphoticum]KLU99409.1 prepilin peptidase [Photobacterium aphoticum]PSU54975.1 prepilin peptidase [Photobacterium aphoticum]GHA38411.1 prepilin peptidase [Photobacterium aphoticum]